ncbi:putative polyprotein [Gerbera capillovirus A]|nr:putative polyprotein [Gerbera capillovirus A]
MAMFRTTEENFFNSLPGNYSDNLLQDYFEGKEQKFTEKLNHFSYNLNNQQKKYIVDLGICLSPVQTETHPHPVSKTIENWIIYQCLPNLLCRNDHLVIMSMKESKAKYVFDKMGLDKGRTQVLNKIFEVKDATRYSGQSIVHSGYGNFPLFLSDVHRRLHRTARQSTFFFHDELHHWSLENFQCFLAKIEPNMVIFTSVFPVEVLKNVKHSMNSIAYSFELQGDNIFFFPDGKGSEPYVQSVKNSWPFTTSKITIKRSRKSNGSSSSNGCSTEEEVVYSISKLCTYGAHHVFACKRGDLLTEPRRYFRDFDLADPSLFVDLFKADGRFTSLEPKIRKWMLEKIVSYLVCLKKPDVESALAKLRQLSDFELSMAEISVVSLISKLLMEYGVSDNLTLFDYLKHPLTSAIHNSVDGLGELKFLVSNKKFALRMLMDRMFNCDLSFEVVLDTKECFFNANSSKTLNQISPRSHVGPDLDNLGLKSVCGEIVHPKINLKVEGPTVDTAEKVVSNGVHVEYEGHNRHLATEPVRIPDSPEETSGSKSDGPSTSQLKTATDEPFIFEWLNKERSNDCFLTSIAKEVCKDGRELVSIVYSRLIGAKVLNQTSKKIRDDVPLTVDDISNICSLMDWRVHIHLGSEVIKINDNHDLRVINLGGRPGHIYNLDLKKKDSEALFEMLLKAQLATFGKNVLKEGVRSNGGHRASVLIKAFTSMNFGALIDRSKLNQGRVIPRHILDWHRIGQKPIDTILNKVRFNLLPFEGFAGSGKTKALLDVLVDANQPGNFIFISSRREVIDQVKKRLVDRREEERTAIEGCFKTFESALLSSNIPDIIILDECSLLPPGYLDLLAVKAFLNKDCQTTKLSSEKNRERFGDQIERSSPLNFNVIFTGDTLQSSFHSESFEPLNGLPNELVYLNSFFEEGEIPYILGTRRFGKPSSSFIELPFYGSGQSDVLLVKDLESLNLNKYKQQIDERKLVALVASHADKRFLSDRYIQTLTFGESQGSTFDYVILYLTPDYLKTSLESCVVALTRHRKGIFIVLEENFFQDFDNPRSQFKKNVGIISKDFTFINEFIEKKATSFDVIDSLPFGHDFELKLEGDPFLKSELSLLKEVEVQSLMPNKVTCGRVNLKVHIPIAEKEILTREISEKMKAREHREFLGMGRGVSEQFKESFKGKERNKSSQAWAAEAIFPRHKNSDSNTFWAACKKRLVFSNPRRNVDDLRRNKKIGQEMLKVFLKYVKLDGSMEPNLWNQCISEFEEKKISKDANTIKNHHVRSLKDWKDNEIFLFIKNQLCTKSEKMFTEAKAGQTLACFSHQLLIKFAPLSRYIEHKVANCLDKRFYIHQKKNFDVLNDWVKEQNFSGLCTESDYEAFDRSQDSMTLAFELELMKFLGIDKNLIDDYIWLKCHLDCKLGTLAVMRFTGEFGTFLFNTLTNMVFTFMRYDIKKDVSICSAGDDMCANRELRVKKEFEHILDRMSLKAKVQITKKPMFCGWLLSEYGIVKSPKLIESRLRVAEEKGTLDSVMDSYFLEYSYAFKMGDNLFYILDDEGQSYHYSLTRFFVKNKNKLKGEARSILESSRQGNDLMFGELSFGNPKLVPIMRKLGQTPKIIDNKVCQLFQCPSFSMSYPNQMTHCTLMPFTQSISTVTSTHWASQAMERYEGSKVAYQYQLLGGQAYSHQIFSVLTKPRLSLYVPKQENMDSSTSGVCYSRSLAFLNYARELMGDSYTWMRGFVLKHKLFNQVLSSTLAGDRLISCIHQITQSQQVILTWIKRAGSFLSLTGLRCLKVLSHSTWISASSTASLIKSILSQCVQMCANWWVKKSKVRGDWWTFLRRMLKKSLVIAWTLVLGLLMIGWFLANDLAEVGKCLISKLIVGSCLVYQCVQEYQMGHSLDQIVVDFTRRVGEYILRDVILILSKSARRICSFLGQLVKNLIKEVNSEEIERKEKIEREMSVVLMVQETIKQGVERQLWDMIDPGNVLHLTPEGEATLDANQKAAKRSILNHYMDYLAGNVAILGSSRETQFPSFNLLIPSPKVIGVEWPQDLKPKINLRDFVKRIEAWASEHENEWVKNSTRRQLFEPFALHAMHFLQMDPENHITNIARKRSYQCRKAPEVAFDFCSGLPRSVITDARAQVISALNSSLFKTEGQKGVFEAKGFVEMNFDG